MNDKFAGAIGLLAGPIARITLRYAIGAMVVYALMSPEVGEEITNDRDIAIVLELTIGGIMGLTVEGMYFVARRFGWQT